MLAERSCEDILQYFNAPAMEDYGRAGNRVDESVVIEEGRLDGFQYTMESLLRSVGLMATLKKEVIRLLKPLTIGTKGELLNPEQAKLFQRSSTQFRIGVKAFWDKDAKQVQVFDEHEEEEMIRDQRFFSSSHYDG